MKRSMSAAMILLATGLLAGCASDQMKQDIAEIRVMAEQAQSTAEQARKSADAAQRGADSAAAKADDAADRADTAMDAARESRACCEANSEKVDRMFRKAMMK